MREDVSRAFPDGVYLGVAVEDCDAAFFDVALAAEGFHALGEEGDGGFGHGGF